MDNLQLYIESLIFASDKAITAKEIKNTINTYLDKTIKEKEITAALEGLNTKYEDDKYPFEVKEIAGGFQFMTKGTYYPVVSQYLKLESKKKLSRSALETLAIISYKQPITKSQIEGIRGVNCDYAVQKLLEKELIEISGRAEGPGRPLLYATSEKFMNHFGLKDLNDLPKIKEFEMPENEIGPKDGEVASPGPASEGAEAQPDEADKPADETTELENKEEVNSEEIAVEAENSTELSEPSDVEGSESKSEEE